MPGGGSVTASRPRGGPSAIRRVAVVTMVLAAVGTAVLVAVDSGVDSEAFLFAAFMAAVGLAGAAVVRRGPDVTRDAALALGVCAAVVYDAAVLFGAAGAVASIAAITVGVVGSVIAANALARRLADATRIPGAPGPTAALLGHSRAVHGVGFSPDGRLLATGSADKTAILWDVTDPAHPARAATLTGHRGAVHGLGFSPDGRLLATGSARKTVILWDVTDPAHPARAGAFTDRGAVRAVGFSPGGQLLATASAEREYSSTGIGGISLVHVAVMLWDVAAPAHPAPAATLTHSRGNLWAFACAVAFSPDGQLLATVSSDQDVTLWDVTDPGHPAETVTLAISSHYWLGPSVHAVAFSPDGRLLATGSDDQTVILWDVSDSARPARATTLAGQGGAVHTVAFSPDGRLLAAGSPDKTAQLWRVR